MENSAEDSKETSKENAFNDETVIDGFDFNNEYLYPDLEQEEHESILLKYRLE